VTHEDRLQAIHDLLIELKGEVATLVERSASMRSDALWLETRVDAVEKSMKPVTWATQTGSALLWICALLGGIGTAVRFFSGKL
jgi:cob(I)alamin adenosyltransferase